MAKDYSKVSKNLISRKDNKSSFVESLNTFFPIGRALFAFSAYDASKPAGERMKARIQISPTFEQTERIIYDFITSQSMIKTLYRETKEAGEEYPPQHILSQGGKDTKEGETIARILKVQGGKKYPIIFRAEQLPGYRDDHGLIIPNYKSGKIETVTVSMTYEALKEFLLSTQMHIRAFVSANYLRNWDEIFSQKWEKGD